MGSDFGMCSSRRSLGTGSENGCLAPGGQFILGQIILVCPPVSQSSRTDYISSRNGCPSFLFLVTWEERQKSDLIHRYDAIKVLDDTSSAPTSPPAGRHSRIDRDQIWVPDWEYPDRHVIRDS